LYFIEAERQSGGVVGYSAASTVGRSLSGKNGRAYQLKKVTVKEKKTQGSGRKNLKPAVASNGKRCTREKKRPKKED